MEKWLEDHHGASMKSRNFQYHDLREDCSNLFPHWSNSTYSLIIDEMNVHVALLYYLFHFRIEIKDFYRISESINQTKFAS